MTTSELIKPTYQDIRRISNVKKYVIHLKGAFAHLVAD